MNCDNYAPASILDFYLGVEARDVRVINMNGNELISRGRYMCNIR